MSFRSNISKSLKRYLDMVLSGLKQSPTNNFQAFVTITCNQFATCVPLSFCHYTIFLILPHLSCLDRTMPVSFEPIVYEKIDVPQQSYPVECTQICPAYLILCSWLTLVLMTFASGSLRIIEKLSRVFRWYFMCCDPKRIRCLIVDNVWTGWYHGPQLMRCRNNLSVTLF